MSEYKRLTERTALGTLCYDAENTSILLNRLAELEDKIEQGTLIELHCKVGDTVYKIWTVGGVKRVVEFVVRRISIYENEICIFYTKSKGGHGNEWCTKPKHIGANIFLTREEAEAKLKELEG